jgi:hypothetical protein
MLRPLLLTLTHNYSLGKVHVSCRIPIHYSMYQIHAIGRFHTTEFREAYRVRHKHV